MFHFVSLVNPDSCFFNAEKGFALVQAVEKSCPFMSNLKLIQFNFSFYDVLQVVTFTFILHKN